MFFFLSFLLALFKFPSLHMCWSVRDARSLPEWILSPIFPPRIHLWNIGVSTGHFGWTQATYVDYFSTNAHSEARSLTYILTTRMHIQLTIGDNIRLAFVRIFCTMLVRTSTYLTYLAHNIFCSIPTKSWWQQMKYSSQSISHFLF